MSNNKLLYCATDKEIYDVLMAAKLRINISVVLELAKDRGIFYSVKDTRETLIEFLSLLPHDYHDLNIILDHREHAGRAEKLTSVTLNTNLTIDEIREVVKEYTELSPPDETVTSHANGVGQYIVNIKYSDIDYSKTRLVQRMLREARIEFYVAESKTVIRMPSNNKAKEIFDKLKNKLDAKKKTDIPADLIEIGEFVTAAERTQFFTILISSLDGFKLDNVTNIKVEPIHKEPGENELNLEEDENKDQAEQEALALVKNVALRGEALLASEEYQSLSRKGFFITSIIWRAKRTAFPQHIVEFEAAFEEPEAGKGFKYSVRGKFNFSSVGREYTKTIRSIEAKEQQELITLIEQTASAAVAKIRNNKNNLPVSNAAVSTGEAK